MTHLLGSNAVIRLLNDDPVMCAAFRQSRAAVALSAIVVFELTYGAYRSKRIAANLHRIADLPFPTIAVEPSDAQVAGEVRAALANGGKLLGPYDVLIAGQALARGLTLVIHDTSEFARVPGLRLEGWEA